MEPMTEKIYKVTFEMVDPRTHPQVMCRCGKHPIIDVADVPEEFWKPVTGSGEFDQYTGLLELVEKGELIRNPQMWIADAPAWQPFEPGSGDQAD